MINLLDSYSFNYNLCKIKIKIRLNLKLLLLVLSFTFIFASEQINPYTQMKKDFLLKNIKKSKDAETQKSLEQIILSDFTLYPYKKNYLLPITYDLKEKNDRKQVETSFQFSIEKPFLYDIFGLNEVISFAYTQKSFWQTMKDSSPFRETNYEPELFVLFPYKYSDTVRGIKLGINHQSNGRDGDYSRSWNRVYLESYLQFEKFFLVPRFWYRIPEKDDDNPDILKYYGYGDLNFIYLYKKYLVELKLRNNLRLNSQNKGSIELDFTFALSDLLPKATSFGFVKIFSGYGESLIDYDKEINRISFGIALSR